MRTNWSRNELIVAFNLYLKTPFSKINAKNRNVIELGLIIHRSSSSIATAAMVQQ
jgi:putative restriction endonuclease